MATSSSRCRSTDGQAAFGFSNSSPSTGVRRGSVSYRQLVHQQQQQQQHQQHQRSMSGQTSFSTNSATFDASPAAVGGLSGTLATVSETSRSSISTVDSQGRVGASVLDRLPRRWATLETAGRCTLALSLVFLAVGVTMTGIGFGLGGMSEVSSTVVVMVDESTTMTSSSAVMTSHPHAGFLMLQICGPVCLATTAVMWVIGAAVSRLWKVELRRRQRAMELRARVQLHALAMDLLHQPTLSPRILRDPVLRRQLLLKLRHQSAMDVSSADTMSTRRSSRVVSVDAPQSATASASRRHHTDSVVSAILREHERRKSRDSGATTSGLIDIEPLLPVTSSSIGAIELPGIHISRIETVEIDDDTGRRSASSRGSTRRYIIIESDFSSGDYSQLSFTSEHSLTGNGSRSSRSRSSRESSNVSSRLWDFSPRESEWDADISHGSRDSQLGQSTVLKVDWGGGPSYGGCGLSSAGPDDDYYESKGRGRDYSLLSPWNVRKNSPSVVTFDIGGEPAVRRHSSPTPQSSPSTSGPSGTLKRNPRVFVDVSAEDWGSRQPGDVQYRGAQPTIGPSSALRHIREVIIPKTGAASVTGTSSSGTTAGGGGTGIEDYRSWLPSAMLFRKRSSGSGGCSTGGDPSVISIRIDENDGDEEEQPEVDEQQETGPVVATEEDTSTTISSTGTNPTTDNSSAYNPCRQIQPSTTPSACVSVTSGSSVTETGSRRPSRTGSRCGFDRPTQPRLQQQRRSLQMKEEGADGEEGVIGSLVHPGGRRGSALSTWRNHTDDSDVERRVARLFYEIEYSATDASLDTADTGTSFNGQQDRGTRCSRRTAQYDLSTEVEGRGSVHESRMSRSADGSVKPRTDVRRISAAAAADVEANFGPQLAIGDSPPAPTRKASGSAASASVAVLVDASGESSGSPVCGILSMTSSTGGGASGTTNSSGSTSVTERNQRRQSTIATQTGHNEEIGWLSNAASTSETYTSGTNITPSSSSTSSTTGSRTFQFLRRPLFASGFMRRSMTGSRPLTNPPTAPAEVRSNVRPFGVSTRDGHRARRLLANLGLS